MNRMTNRRWLTTGTLVAACLAHAPAALAVVVGQADTFQDGTTAGWLVGALGAPHPAPPMNVASGGPAGPDDNFLRLTAIGGGSAGSRLAVVNLSQWTGDFIAGGVTAIRMDLSNLGATDLALRLMLADPGAGPPSNVAFSSAPVLLPAGGGWTSVSFPITPADLSAGLGSVVDALTHATELRIFHNPDPAFPGPAVVASLGVDNITAVPLPPALALLGSGLLALRARRRTVPGPRVEAPGRTRLGPAR